MENYHKLLRHVRQATWPKQQRTYVEGEGLRVGLSVFTDLTGEYVKPRIYTQTDGIVTIMKEANLIMGERCRKDAPKGFGWTSLQINVNTTSDWHFDRKNVGPSCVMVLGDYVGDELEVEGNQPEALKNEATMIDGRRWHRSIPFWEGER